MATGRACGRIRANPTRRTPYAANMPNAIDPTEAQINIAKFNTSAIAPVREMYSCDCRRIIQFVGPIFVDK
jgi:hypothetical protein